MKTITQLDLRNRSGQILREAERGEQILITVEGRPVALLGPCARRQWVPRAEVIRLIGSIRRIRTFTTTSRSSVERSARSPHGHECPRYEGRWMNPA
jgi:prevent-host-death family protein